MDDLARKTEEAIKSWIQERDKMLHDRAAMMVDGWMATHREDKTFTVVQNVHHLKRKTPIVVEVEYAN